MLSAYAVWAASVYVWRQIAVRVSNSAAGGESRARPPAIRNGSRSLACVGDPNILAPPAGGFLQVSVGYQFACAVRKSDSHVLCW